MSLGAIIAIGIVALSGHVLAAWVVAGWAQRKGYSFLGFFLLGVAATWMTSGAVAFTRTPRTRTRPTPRA